MKGFIEEYRARLGEIASLEEAAGRLGTCVRQIVDRSFRAPPNVANYLKEGEIWTAAVKRRWENPSSWLTLETAMIVRCRSGLGTEFSLPLYENGETVAPPVSVTLDGRDVAARYLSPMHGAEFIADGYKLDITQPIGNAGLTLHAIAHIGRSIGEYRPLNIQLTRNGLQTTVQFSPEPRIEIDWTGGRATYGNDGRLRERDTDEQVPGRLALDDFFAHLLLEVPKEPRGYSS